MRQILYNDSGQDQFNHHREGYHQKILGCEHVDVSENLAIERAKNYLIVNSNVQPHLVLKLMVQFIWHLKPGDTTLAMSLNSGGHLTHGAKPAQSGKWFNALHYEVDKETGLIDYNAVEKLAIEHKPKLIIAAAVLTQE